MHPSQQPKAGVFPARAVIFPKPRLSCTKCWLRCPLRSGFPVWWVGRAHALLLPIPGIPALLLPIPIQPPAIKRGSSWRCCLFYFFEWLLQIQPRRGEIVAVCMCNGEGKQQREKNCSKPSVVCRQVQTTTYFPAGKLLLEKKQSPHPCFACSWDFQGEPLFFL